MSYNYVCSIEDKVRGGIHLVLGTDKLDSLHEWLAGSGFTPANPLDPILGNWVIHHNGGVLMEATVTSAPIKSSDGIDVIAYLPPGPLRIRSSYERHLPTND